MITRPRTNRRNRRKLPSGQSISPTDALILSHTTDAGHISLNLDRPMVLSGIPAAITAGGKACDTAAMTDQQTLRMHFTGTASTYAGIIIPPHVPQVRTQRGGFLAPASETF